MSLATSDGPGSDGPGSMPKLSPRLLSCGGPRPSRARRQYGVLLAERQAEQGALAPSHHCADAGDVVRVVDAERCRRLGALCYNFVLWILSTWL
jgi:hypothetical protein